MGTAVGFVVGGLACLAVDYFVGDWFDGLIDKIAV